MGAQSGCGHPVRRELHPSQASDTDVNLDCELGVVSELRK